MCSTAWWAVSSIIGGDQEQWEKRQGDVCWNGVDGWGGDRGSVVVTLNYV